MWSGVPFTGVEPVFPTPSTVGAPPPRPPWFDAAFLVSIPPWARRSHLCEPRQWGSDARGSSLGLRVATPHPNPRRVEVRLIELDRRTEEVDWLSKESKTKARFRGKSRAHFCAQVLVYLSTFLGKESPKKISPTKPYPTPTFSRKTFGSHGNPCENRVLDERKVRKTSLTGVWGRGRPVGQNNWPDVAWGWGWG